MPYIKPEDREALENDLDRSPENAGELNYIISRLCWYYYEQHGSRYAQINDIVGALEGAKMEFYRRVAAPYEDKKRLENGDVYV